MTDRELMQQALDALCDIIPANENRSEINRIQHSAITALRSRLAQPEQEQNSTCNKALRAEGKGYPRTCRKCGKGPCIADRMEPEQTQLDVIPDAFNEWWNADYDDTGNPYRKDSPAYWAWSGWKAASKQPEQEPVATVRTWHKNGDQHAELDDWGLALALLPDGKHDLYTTPPQRKPLTDGQLADLWYKQSLDWLEFGRAIEAAHGIGEKPDAA